MRSRLSIISNAMTAGFDSRLTSLVSLGLAVPVLAALVSCMSTPIGSGGVADINVTNDPNFRWGELQIAVNPKNPNNILYADVGVGFTKACQEHSHACELVQADFGIGRPFPQPKGMFTVPDFNRINIFASFDRGKTWRRVFLPVHPPQHPDLQGMGDPSLTVTPDGTFYASWDDNNWGTPEHGIPDTGIAVTKSTDGGLTWSDPVLSGTPTDGPKITADQTTGTVYVSSTGTLGPLSSGDPNAPKGAFGDRWLVSSADGVKWTTPNRFGGTDGAKQFSAPGSFSAAYGIMSVAFRATDAGACAFFGGGTAPCVMFQTTNDSGVTWNRHRVPAVSSSGTPMVAADPTKKGHYTVAVLNEGGKEFQVFQTQDSGSTWSAPTVVAEDAMKLHFKWWLVYSRQGVLGMMWRTFQPPPGKTATLPTGPGPAPGGGPNYPYNIWAALSRDGGATFSEPLQVSSADSPAPDPSLFGGAGDDYSGLAVDSGYVYVGWADWRPGERQGFFRAIRFDEFKSRKH
jgi:hypothetical protein